MNAAKEMNEAALEFARTKVEFGTDSVEYQAARGRFYGALLTLTAGKTAKPARLQYSYSKADLADALNNRGVLR